MLSCVRWSLQLIQVLLLSAEFLQSTDEPHQCWVAVGIAIRVAQSLGLRLNSTSEESQYSQQAVELLRRVNEI